MDQKCNRYKYLSYAVQKSASTLGEIMMLELTEANIDESYRKGIEVEGFYKITKKMIWSGNLTLSKIKSYIH